MLKSGLSRPPLHSYWPAAARPGPYPAPPFRWRPRSPVGHRPYLLQLLRHENKLRLGELSAARVLADLAKGSMRRMTDALIEALTGSFTSHHAFLARGMLDRIDACTATETRLHEHIEVMLQPFRRRIELLVTIRGSRPAQRR